MLQLSEREQTPGSGRLERMKIGTVEDNGGGPILRNPDEPRSVDAD